MEKPPKVYHYIFILFQFTSVLGQVNSIDSLKTLLKTDRQDTNRAIHLFTLCSNLRNIGEYESGLSYGRQALQMSRQLKFKRGIANSQNNLGNIYFKQCNYPAAL